MPRSARSEFRIARLFQQSGEPANLEFGSPFDDHVGPIQLHNETWLRINEVRIFGGLGQRGDVDVILAGDCWYDARLAERVLPWLRRAQDRGIEVLVGDPGRRYLPTDELIERAAYDVRTTTELEDLALKKGRVYALRPSTGHA